MRKRRFPQMPKGLTVIEVLIAVVLMALLATAGIIQVKRAQMDARAQIALGHLRTISTACRYYFVAFKRYPPSLEILGKATPPLLDAEMAVDPLIRQGYAFVYQPQRAWQGYTVIARPTDYGVTGIRAYMADERGMMHYTDEDRSVDMMSDPSVGP